MKRTITIHIPGLAVPKGRPRLARNGCAYTPEKTRSYEAKIKAYADDALVWRQSVRKVYAEKPGVTVMMTGEVAV